MEDKKLESFLKALKELLEEYDAFIFCDINRSVYEVDNEKMQVSFGRGKDQSFHEINNDFYIDVDSLNSKLKIK